MRRALPLALTMVTTASPALSAKPPIDHLYGPAPTWSDYRRIGEADISARLIDPESARITWLGGYHKGEFKPFLAPRVAGHVACGTVNAKNRMGGYTGAAAFITVVDYGRVLYAEIDRGTRGMIADNCVAGLQAGLFPPLPEDETKAASSTISPAPASATVHTASGMTLRAMPDGAYVAAVASGSPAAGAGFAPGMVVATVNGIPLGGMGDAMLKVVDAAGPDATLTIIGGKTVKLGGRP